MTHAAGAPRPSAIQAAFCSRAQFRSARAIAISDARRASMARSGQATMSLRACQAPKSSSRASARTPSRISHGAPRLQEPQRIVELPGVLGRHVLGREGAQRTCVVSRDRSALDGIPETAHPAEALRFGKSLGHGAQPLDAQGAEAFDDGGGEAPFLVRGQRLARFRVVSDELQEKDQRLAIRSLGQQRARHGLPGLGDATLHHGESRREALARLALEEARSNENVRSVSDRLGRSARATLAWRRPARRRPGRWRRGEASAPIESGRRTMAASARVRW